MKVKIDENLCTGHGRCWVVAKEFYKLDDNGYNAERGQVIPVSKDEEQWRRAYFPFVI